MQRFLDLFIFINCSTCFRRFLRPSSGAQNCTYSARYCQTNTAACCYRGSDGSVSGGSSAHHQEHKTVQTVSCIVKQILLPAATVDQMEVFQAVPPPIIRSTKLYIQRQVLSNKYCCLLLPWMRWKCFRRFLCPSSGAQNCTYSVTYCQTNTAACCYRG